LTLATDLISEELKHKKILFQTYISLINNHVCQTFLFKNSCNLQFFLRYLRFSITNLKIMRKRIQSFGYAGRGIKTVFTSEANMKIHLVITTGVIICGFIFKINVTEWSLCLLCMALVIGGEMLNTAIENIVNLASPEFHPLAGKAKDIAAGAVLICAIISVIVGCLIFLPKIWVMLAG